MTAIIDDAGYGDLLFGVVIGAFRPETGDFVYDLIDVRYFQRPLFGERRYLSEASRISLGLVNRLKLSEGERVEMCQGEIFDDAEKALIEHLGDGRVGRVRVKGEAQRLTELAYLDELRNLGYEPIEERTEKWAKSFYHMLHWVEADTRRLRWAKSGWPRLARFRLFRERER